MNTENVWIIVSPPSAEGLAIKRGSKLNEGKNKKGQNQNMCIGSPKKSDVMQYRTGVGGVDFSLYSLIYYEFM